MSDRDDDLPEILVRRKIRHARAEARSKAKRKGKNAPCRDDIARIALFILLMQYRRERHTSARREMWKTLTGLLGDAGYDAKEAGAVFDKMVPSVGADLDRYFMLRRIEPAVRNKWRDRNGLPALPDRSAADKE